MGVYLTFYRVTAEQLAAAEANPDDVDELCDEENRWGGNLTEVWQGMTDLLERARVPVDLINGRLDSDGDFLDDDGHYFTWTVDDVADAARHLRATPFERLAPHVDGPDPRYGWSGDDLEEIEEDYATLVEFFDRAAAAGDAAIRRFG